MRKISGFALIVIGLIHSAIALGIPGAIGFSGIWQEIIDAGGIDVVKSDSLRIWGYYWFLVSGFLMMLYGFLCYWIENQLNLPLPSFAGFGLLIVSCFCIILDIDDTGFWFVLLVAINKIIASQRKQLDRLNVEQQE